MAVPTPAAPEQPKAFTYVDEDTLLKLRNVGTRVRKSVTEGFQRTVSVPADPLAATKRLPFTQTPSFISSNDAMRELLAARAAKNKGTSSAPSSPQQRPKRTLGGADEDEEDADLEDDEMNLDEDAPATASGIRAAREAAAQLKEEKKKREIRPLKRSASRPGGVATQSLPASMFRFSHDPSNKAGPTVAQIAEEEDWSGNFGCSSEAAGATALSADLDLEI
ncbi:hypothetical protein PYCCODRAFT_1433535 [Trametes coccinea BRFM310]|uniref:Uncharacterized protein n=1 Tax=Trametes coccinea (strain BRFM310) TaxID=1353009 RepID=A0A1Y2IVC5_TRAC3|nr:hypothetical protein PYCCODRAFT_1433535 [Trametes coccinea BRFM310]